MGLLEQADGDAATSLELPPRVVEGGDVVDNLMYVTMTAAFEIGRASCRERGGDLGGRRIIKKKKGNRRCSCDWSSDVCSSDLLELPPRVVEGGDVVDNLMYVTMTAAF